MVSMHKHTHAELHLPTQSDVTLMLILARVTNYEHSKRLNWLFLTDLKDINNNFCIFLI